MEDYTYEEFKKHIDDLNKIITVDDESININVHYEYVIPIDRCNTHEKILGWAFHLTEKTWMTTEILRHFLKIAHQQSGLKIPHP